VLDFTVVSRNFGQGQAQVVALRDVTLHVPRGQLLAVTGQSGSGKSTLLAVAGGLDRPSSGQVMVAGQDLTAESPTALAALRRRTIGYVFQRYNLIPSLRAWENVSLPMELDGQRRAEAQRLAVAALGDVGIEELYDRYPSQLSGGPAQRVAIARAVVGSRSLVLADEPTGALDSETGVQVIKLLQAKASGGATVVLVTHEAAYAALADRVVTLANGAISSDNGE